MPTTADMGLILPVPTITLGPLYANMLNNALTVVDSHNHTAGQGVQVPSGGLNIDADLPANNNNITALRSVRFQDQLTPLVSVSDAGCLYIAAGDLYYNNGTGVFIQLTAGAALNATSIGGIGGDYATSGASVYYLNLNKTFFFTQSAGVSASMDNGPITIRENVALANGVTIQSPSSLSSSYSLTLLTNLPASSRVLSVSNTGQIAAGAAVIVPGDVQAGFGLTPTGAVIPFGGTTAPTGYLLCDGSAISRVTFSTLFGVIGTAFGAGDTTTTFNIPDMQGYFPRGVSNASGRDPDAASRTAMNSGGNTGNNVGSVQADIYGAHNHRQRGSNIYRTDGGVTGAANSTNSNDQGPTSTDGGNETRPKNAYLNYLIKT